MVMLPKQIAKKANMARLEKYHSKNIENLTADVIKEFPNVNKKTIAAIVSATYKAFQARFTFFRK